MSTPRKQILDKRLPLNSLAVCGKKRAMGVYSATQGPNAVTNVLSGDGEPLILEGNDPGAVISIR